MAKPYQESAQGKENEGGYETFDSGGGPTISKKDSGNYSHRDCELTSEGEDAEHGAVPEMPQKKR